MIRNDEGSVKDMRKMNLDGIVLNKSPGPGTPTEKSETEYSVVSIGQLGPSFSILGICLGHRKNIVSPFGGSIKC